MYPDVVRPIFEGLPRLSALNVGPLRLWLSQPLGMVTQFDVNSHVNTAIARLIAGPATESLLALYRQKPRPMRFAHDWRNVTSYEPDARLILTEWALRLGAERILQVDILLGPKTPNFVKVGAMLGQAALAAAGVTLRVHYELGAFVRFCEAPSLKPHTAWCSGGHGLS